MGSRALGSAVSDDAFSLEFRPSFSGASLDGPEA